MIQLGEEVHQATLLFLNPLQVYILGHTVRVQLVIPEELSKSIGERCKPVTFTGETHLFLELTDEMFETFWDET